MLEQSLKLELYTIDGNVFVLLGQNGNVNGKRHLDLSSKDMNEPYSFILVDGLEEYLGNLALYKGDKWRQLGLKINTEPIYVWLAEYDMINKNKINLQRW